MNKLKYPLKAFAVLFIVGATSLSAQAQKLPPVQKTSLRAPADIKIDGKTTEWKDQFQAYNNATEVYYTIANDDDNLYLVVKAEKANMIKKSIMAGITLAINKSLKKDGLPVSVTFPVLERKDNYLLTACVTHARETAESAAELKHRKDSLMELGNKGFANVLRLISVTGVKDIPDSLISVYNEQNIRATARFDSQINYIYELAIPLKYLGLSVKIADTFSYHILLNGAGHHYVPETDAKNPGQIRVDVQTGVATSSINLINQDWVNTTDFWGQYTLAKKIISSTNEELLINIITAALLPLGAGPKAALNPKG